jgi:hypothetical protein
MMLSLEIWMRFCVILKKKRKEKDPRHMEAGQKW